MLRVVPCPLPLEYRAASSNARLTSCWALPPWFVPLEEFVVEPGGRVQVTEYQEQETRDHLDPASAKQRVHIFTRDETGLVSVSAHSAGAYTATLLVMVNVVKGGGRAPSTVTSLG